MPVDAKVQERFQSPFAPLELSAAAAAEIERLAAVLVASSVRAYEQHLFEAHSVVDEAQWKLMYRKDDVRSYAERLGGTLASAWTSSGGLSSSTDSSSGSSNSSNHNHNASDKLPVVLVTGTIAGGLDDTIYGFVCPTIDAMRIKTSYVHDTLVRGCVLAPIVRPTADRPFRSLSVKWMEKGQRAHTRAVLSNRDFVYMESTGVELLKDGQRVGFHLVHSVQFPETPAREGAIRGNMSMCAVYREKGPGVTEVFLQGFLNPAGGIVRSIITRSAARALVSVAKNVHCANMKKLLWAVRHQRHRVLSSKDAASDSLLSIEANTIGTSARAIQEGEGEEEDDGDDGKHKKRVPMSVNEPCPSCAKLPSRLTRLRAFATGSSEAKRRRCKLCRQAVCSGCRVDRKLSFLLEDRRLVQLPCAFCVPCMERVLAIPAAAVARDEMAVESEFHQWQDQYTTSSASRSSSGPEYTFVDELN